MVRHSKAKEAMFPYPANTISGTFFWKEVAPKAPSGLGSEAMVDPCLHPRDNLRACLPPVTIGTLQGQESPPISHYSFQDILEGELPVWVTPLAACVWPQSEIQVLSSFLCGDISVSTLQTTADDLLVRAGAVSTSSATAVMSCHSSATERNAV